MKTTHRFSSIYYKLVVDGIIVAAGSKLGIRRLWKAGGKAGFVGCGSPTEKQIGKAWGVA